MYRIYLEDLAYLPVQIVAFVIQYLLQTHSFRRGSYGI